MDVPAVFASYGEGGLTASECWFQGTLPKPSGRTAPFRDAVSGLSDADARMPVVVVDTDSLGGRMFTENVLKSMRVRGADIWYMTWIETVDDVFDAFNTSADMVMGPYHSSESDAELEDILGVSDSFIPVVYARDGKAVLRKGRSGDLPRTMSSLQRIGYHRVCVLDTDSRVSAYDWDSVAGEMPSAVPFTERDVTGDRFGTRVLPLRL